MVPLSKYLLNEYMLNIYLLSEYIIDYKSSLFLIAQ